VRRVVLLVAWTVFLGDLLVGAGLLLSPKEDLRTVGLAMLLSAVLAMSALTLWFYLQNRRQKGRRGKPITEEQVP
jgi:hypothetical protein